MSSSARPPSPPPLKEHQQVGIEWLRRVGRGLLGDAPRTGKTAQLLLAAEGRTLVVAPPHLEGVWRQQHALWRPSLDLSFVGYASVAKRAPNAQGHMRKTLPIPRGEWRGPWQTLICDEAHALVNPKANWSAAVSAIQSERLYLATGTPIRNWAPDLLVPLRLLWPRDRRFTNRRRWEEQWFDVWEPPWGGRQVGDLRRDRTWEQFWLDNGLDGFDGRMLQRDVDLGVPFTEQHVEVDMTPAQAKAYRELKKQYVTWLEESGTEVSAWSSGGLHTKLAQVATGLEIVDPGGSRGSGKMTALAQLLEDAPRSPTLVFCHFRATADAIESLALSMGLTVGKIRGGIANSERDRVEREFQEGRLDVLVGSISTVSEGLTFSRATTEIFVEHAWSPYRNDQAIKRAMVWGKTSPVHVIHLWTKGSVDTGMRETVKGKTDQQVRALSARAFRATLDGAS